MADFRALLVGVRTSECGKRQRANVQILLKAVLMDKTGVNLLIFAWYRFTFDVCHNSILREREELRGTARERRRESESRVLSRISSL